MGAAVWKPRRRSIVVDSLSFDYGRGAVFTNVGLTVRQGTKVAIIGRSGAGKTTLLEVINGDSASPDGEREDRRAGSSKAFHRSRRGA